MADKRDFSVPVALNWTQDGTDIDFGSLSQAADRLYGVRNGITALFGHEVRDLRHESDGSWTVKVETAAPGTPARSTRNSSSSGRGAMHCRCCRRPASRRPRASAGFPIGGKFLRTLEPGAGRGAPGQGLRLPPLGAPRCRRSHLDARIINGKSWLLFGPFAGWSPKFLKQGKVTDLPLSVKPNNLPSMVGVGRDACWVWCSYLIGQLRLSDGRSGAGAARIRPRRSRFRMGAQRSPGSGCRSSARPRARAACWSSAPRCCPPPTAASRACSARRPGPRRPCRRCST